MFGRLSILIACVLLGFPLLAEAAIVVVDTDTMIDVDSPLNGKRIDVVDGPDGPTHVTVTDGAFVRGFAVRGSSTLLLQDASSTFPGSTEDTSHLILRNGQVACTDFECAVTSFGFHLQASDQSEISVYGGRVDLPIQMLNQSTLTVYNDSLKLVPNGGPLVLDCGYTDGALPFNCVATLGNFQGRIRLIVPEPSALALSLFSLHLFYSCIRPRRIRHSITWKHVAMDRSWQRTI